MTDRAQFEAMLEALINEDQETAKEIFHNIVVGKSREIYEELLESDFSQDSGNPYAKKSEPVDDEEDDEMDMDSEEDDEMDSEEDDEMDSGDEMDADDSEEDPFADEEGEDDSAIEDRVMDLEDALEDLKAEFEQLLQGEEHEEENNPDIHGGALDGMDGMDGGDMGGEPDMVMEYVNKVPSPKHGDNGVNTRSAVAGKNDMGGTTANIAKSFSTEKGGTQGGLLKPSTTLQDGGNMNKPGATAGKSAFKKKEPGHGAETKGKSETADNKQSLLRQAKR
jgi:hypothetical protein